MRKAAPLPRDSQGNVVPSCNTILAIQNISITTASYTAITVPNDVFCKAVMIKTRSGNDYRIATSSNPSTYMKLTGPVSFNLTLRKVQTFAYIRADSTSDTLEILYMD